MQEEFTYQRTLVEAQQGSRVRKTHKGEEVVVSRARFYQLASVRKIALVDICSMIGTMFVAAP